jgi:ribosomal protein L37AE/L43A
MTPEMVDALLPYCEACEVFMRRTAPGEWECPRCGAEATTDGYAFSRKRRSVSIKQFELGMYTLERCTPSMRTSAENSQDLGQC